MKTTTQQKFNRTKTALAVGIALFAVSEIASAVYVARTSELTATADAAEVGEEAITIDILSNDGQADASTLAIATQPTQGTVSLSAGQVVYTPNEGFSGTDTFTYTVRENEWRNGADNNPLVTPYTMAVNAMAPIASSYAATDGNGNAVTVNIASGTFAAPGFWNENPIGDGVVGKSWKPSSSVAQLEGCNAGDDAATPISVTMNWTGERRANAAQFNPGSNQFTITTDTAPTPVRVDGVADGIVLQIFQDTASNVTSSTNGAGSITDIAGSVGVGTDSWKFSTISTWSNLSAADFETMPITILASTYNDKTWYSSASSFEASVDYSTCQLNTGTATVTITAKEEEESSGGGGGGSIDKIALFSLGLFGLNALRRRRQA